MNVSRLFFILALFLVSCEDLKQEVNLDGFSDQTPRLAVACFISPQDSVIAAKVVRTRSVFDDESLSSLDITDATVKLTSSAKTVTLPYDGRRGYYRISPQQLPILAGQSYTLTIETKDGQKAEASCTVPQPVALQRLALDSVKMTEDGVAKKRFFVRYYWQDVAGQPNYYQPEGVFSPQCPTCQPTTYPVYFSASRLFYTDQDGSKSNFESAPGYLGPAVPEEATLLGTNYQSALIRGSLLHVDENFYRYHVALDQQRQADNNPFAEPVLIPTNIKGGLGCFGAYNRSTATLTVRP
ncbi:DUF4249 domain-containing protein [Tellurirhabdus bombi]|uniref:DUF4249 domain-containing protein n=1 Tax=Tellurirhabdus bombi TaxID=2907205 RepID=UPI001F157A27|nr:DUF4249 domain-containing protein [Tellurirhabdus bombi]